MTEKDNNRKDEKKKRKKRFSFRKSDSTGKKKAGPGSVRVQKIKRRFRDVIYDSIPARKFRENKFIVWLNSDTVKNRLRHSRLSSSRHTQVVALLAVLAVVLVARLFVLTVVQHNRWEANSESTSTRTIYTTASRGNIYDRYGRLLAGNKQNFSIRMSVNGQTSRQLNKSITRLIKVLEKNGDDYVDEFPIKIKNGKYYYTYDQEINSWLKKNDLPEGTSAEKAFNALREKLGIDKSLSNYEAQTEMQQTYSTYPPIDITTMQYTYTQDKEDFLTGYELDTGISAKKAFRKIKKKMDIDESMSDTSAREIMCVRDKIHSLGYNQYLPALVAENVSNNTVMTIEEGGNGIKGAEVVSETTRYYPNGSLASHVLGYMGQISESEAAQKADQGYEADSMIGEAGIEEKYESVLRGTNGKKVVQVNASGEVTSTLSETSPKKGKDVTLTLDAKLQKEAEWALENGIAAAQTGGTLNSKYGAASTAEAAPNAETGAAVCLDVKTGDVLAMASYPDYDPNDFATGISTAKWEALQSTNPRDSLAAAPLYNLATMCAVQPGSTFKMVTASAALECGLNPYTTLYDNGHIVLGGKSFGCVIWNMYKQNHGYLNMFRAIEVSCNYYFYDIATGKDWYTGTKLNYDKKITVDTITKYASEYGLGKSTGIELDETVVSVPSKKKKISSLKNTLSNTLNAAAETYFKESTYSDSTKLKTSIDAICNLITENPKYDELVNSGSLEKLGVKKSKVDDIADMVVFTYASQAKWTTGDSFNICIGQGDNSYTPLQICNYVATIGNSGKHNSVSIVKSVENKGTTKKSASTKVDVSQENLDYIMQAMKLDGNGDESTVSDTFSDLDFEVACKTGTAQKEGYINPESEVDYIKSHLSSFDSSLSWTDVEKEAKRLMKKYPDTFSSEDTAIRRAVINLSDKNLTSDDLDAYKDTYDPFAWIVCLAPADDPEIAVCVMIPQGMTAANAAPIAKHIMAAYFDLQTQYKTYTINSGVN
ncbi:MAG: penicillin-binding transpeptidase domain-containing protein [Anaerovoracaceae bacterium]|jgi:penicillin-binding protein 2